MMNTMINNIKAAKVAGTFTGKEMNPKKFDESTVFGPGDVVTYFNNRPVDNTVVKDVTIVRKEAKEIEEIYIQRVIYSTDDINWIQEVTRMDLSSVGFISADVIEYESDEDLKTIVIKLASGIITPIYFPRTDSNVGVYTNSKGSLSYVIDGRVVINKGKLEWISTNQEALTEFEKEKLASGRKSFSKILSEKQWKIEDMEKAQETGDKIIKAITWIGECRYISFPQFNDRFPINVVWGANEEWNWENILSQYPEVRKQIRISSLAQNGINASAGRLLNDGTIGEAKEFFGTKAKFDISANQLVKNFKSAKKNKERCLIVLAEITIPGTTSPMNGLGNTLATKSAYDEYKSLLTDDKAKSKNIKYPAHKVFIQAGDREVVRVKGATSIIDAKVTKADKSIEDKIVVLPPREYTPTGELGVKLDPFKFLLACTDNPVQMVELEVKVGTEIIKQTVPAIYCDVYEDAYHSAVYSLRVKEQNFFYYGALYDMFKNNGWNKMATAISVMLDHQKIAQAMNFSDLEKIAFEEITEDEIFN